MICTVLIKHFRQINTLHREGAATEAKMSAESRTLARESPIRSMYFEARITRISYTLGRSCDPLAASSACHRVNEQLRTINNALCLKLTSASVIHGNFGIWCMQY